MSNRSLTTESEAWAAIYPLDQLRMNAAFPPCQMFCASHSWCVTTPGGEMEPTQRAALSHARMFRALFTVTFPCSSSIVPPPSDTCHSRASQVRASEAAPCHTNPQKSLLRFARSPVWIALEKSSTSRVLVVGG